MIVSYTVEHAMRYDYETPVQASVMTLYLCPLRDRAQTLREFSVRTDPEGRLFEFTDPFGNTAHFLDRPRPHARFEVKARSRVEVGRSPPLPRGSNPVLRRRFAAPFRHPSSGRSRTRAASYGRAPRSRSSWRPTTSLWERTPS